MTDKQFETKWNKTKLNGTKRDRMELKGTKLNLVGVIGRIQQSSGCGLNITECYIQSKKV